MGHTLAQKIWDSRVVHRADGSGTSYTWTDFLAKTDADWQAQVGAGLAPKWPVGRGAKLLLTGVALCGVCVAECPVNAIYAEEDVPADQQHFTELNADLAKGWPSITKTKAPLPEADDFKDVKEKLSLLER